VKYKIVAVRDRVADVFGVPNFVLNLGAAVRGFGDEIRRPHSDERPNPFNQHPDDFDLYHLGEYDDAAATFEVHAPKQIAVGKNYV
jgi:hypothetical protein